MYNLKKWLKSSHIRFDWGIRYLYFGAISLILSKILVDKYLVWVIGWSSIGIGAWLINSRDNKGKRDGHHSHYLFYFGFALFVCSLAAFSTARQKSILDLPLSALIGLTMGFASERLNELIKMP